MKKIITIAATALALMSTPAFAKTLHHPYHPQYQDEVLSPYGSGYMQQFEAGTPYQEYRRHFDGNDFQSQWNDGN